jgi:hypothetical protein|tara:strand:+ start:3145 stop:3345 length:201 start_codon:yes stop_codon:yes gene_type:complete
MEIIGMKEKVSFTVDKDLIGWFRLYIKDEHTTMSAVINNYILNLKRNNITSKKGNFKVPSEKTTHT